MPVGQFLDSFPTVLFVAAHVAFIGVGIFCVRKVTGREPGRALALWLYPVSQIGFLLFFAGASTMKLAVLVEQMLILALVVAIARRAGPAQNAA